MTNNNFIDSVVINETSYPIWISSLGQIVSKDTNIADFSTWSNKRVQDDGTLTYSPSQLTTEKILYVGKWNILKITATSTTRQLSISYYQKNTSGDGYTYIQSDITAIRYIKYVCAKYDYCRISFVGTSESPPVIGEFTAETTPVINHEFAGKNIAFMGDSITTFNGVSEGGYESPYYPTGDVLYYEQTYAKMFWDACGGTNISVSAISNSSWRDQGNANCPSPYENTRITRLSANGTPDYVFINMGTNDPYSSNIGDSIGYTFDVNTLEQNVVYTSYAIQTTIRKIQTTYPNAKIILLIPKFASAINTGNYTFEKWEKVCDYIKEIGDMYGVYRIVDLRKCGITKDTFSQDCISSAMHPNYNGMKKMGEYLIDQLLIK